MPDTPSRAQMVDFLNVRVRDYLPHTGVCNVAVVGSKLPCDCGADSLLDSIVAALGSTEDLCDDGGCREHAYQEYLRGKAEGRGEPVAWVARSRAEMGTHVWRSVRSTEEQSRLAFAAAYGAEQLPHFEFVPLYAAAPRPTADKETK